MIKPATPFEFYLSFLSYQIDGLRAHNTNEGLLIQSICNTVE